MIVCESIIKAKRENKGTEELYYVRRILKNKSMDNREGIVGGKHVIRDSGPANRMRSIK